jgi:hypothetical protein
MRKRADDIAAAQLDGIDPFKFDSGRDPSWPHILALRLSMDSKRLIAATQDTVKAFDVLSGKELYSRKMKDDYTLSADSIAGDAGVFARTNSKDCALVAAWRSTTRVDDIGQDLLGFYQAPYLREKLETRADASLRPSKGQKALPKAGLLGQ